MRSGEAGKEPLLKVEQAAKTYGKQVVLDGVSLILEKGDRVAIMGSSGSGKSTLLNCIAGLEELSSGQILFKGNQISRETESASTELRRGEICSVFQFFHLLPTLRAWENVEFPLLLQGVAKQARLERVNALLEEVGLTHRKDAWPSELSGGEMQRLAIARALITEPSLVLADEPTGSLDSKNSERILRMLLDLTARHGTALLMVTHDVEATDICEKVLHMADGKLLEEIQ